VGAGDEIVKVGEADERMTVAEINALLIRRIIPAIDWSAHCEPKPLSPGWRSSLSVAERPNDWRREWKRGLAPPAAAHPLHQDFGPSR